MLRTSRITINVISYIHVYVYTDTTHQGNHANRKCRRHTAVSTGYVQTKDMETLHLVQTSPDQTTIQEVYIMLYIVYI